MKPSTLLVSFLYAGASLAQIPPSFSKNPKFPSKIVPNQFIIEVDDLSNIPTKRAFRRSLDAVYEVLRDRAVAFEIKDEFDEPSIFVGAAVAVKTPQDAALLARTPGVKAIRPVLQYNPPKSVMQKVVSGPNDPAVPADTQSTHVMTGVDKLHAEGVLGSGITIGIIDSGIDYTHPALGGGFGPGYKVVGGYDFVGNHFTGHNMPVPGPDPIDKCDGHGTHVAGIIGANPRSPFNISGVAYKASLYAYRIFSCNSTAPDNLIIKALLRGAKDGNDILTLSLGHDSGWTEGMASVVASRIAASGKIVTIAAGNDGEYGAWYTSSPANGIDTISVASVDSIIIPLQSFLVQGVEHDPIVYSANFSLPTTGTFPIYAISNDTTVTADACDPLPNTTPNLSKYVTLVRRGTCSFVEKLQNVANKGANIVLIYDNGRGFGGIDTGQFTNAAFIQAADGEFLVKQFVAGVNVTLVFPHGGRPVDYNDPRGGLVSLFTSYGPTNDLFFKPAIAAPGGNILSTFPTNMGSYAVDSGTSMATPFVAGSAALLLSVKGKSKHVAHGARTLFQTTAHVIPSSKRDGDPLQTVAQQGAGLINVYNAIHSTTHISEGEMILNDTAHFRPVHTFRVKNNGKTRTPYKLRHVPAGTALTVREGTIFPSLGPVPLSDVSAIAMIVPDQFNLEPGESQIVVTTFQLPTFNVDKSLYPVFSGFIEVAGPSATDTYHVSYLGLGASLREKQILDNTDIIFGFKLLALLNATGQVQTRPTNYTFVNGDAPTLLWRLVFGTRLLHVDLVDPNIKFKPTIASRALLDEPSITFPTTYKDGSFARVNVVGPLTEFKDLARNNEDISDNGFYTFLIDPPVFANSTAIPNGSYRVLLRVLRVTGNPKEEEDYESWLSPIFGINR